MTITEREANILAELRRVSPTDSEYLQRLEQALEIAKLGGIEDRTLEAVLALAVTGERTPTVDRVLAEVGIDMRPWPEAIGQRVIDAARSGSITWAELLARVAESGS